jgi:hypothetical protein
MSRTQFPCGHAVGDSAAPAHGFNAGASALDERTIHSPTIDSACARDPSADPPQ